MVGVDAGFSRGRGRTMLSIWAYAESRMAGDRGGTMVEYALILVTIAIVVVVGALVVGTITNDKYVDVSQCIDTFATC